MAPELKLIVNIFINNAAQAVRMISGRQLSMAELGAIKEQAIAAIQAAFLRGKIVTLKKVLGNGKDTPAKSVYVGYFDKLYARKRPSSGGHNSGNSGKRD